MRTGKVGRAQGLIRWTPGTLTDSLKTIGPVTWTEPFPCPGGPHNSLSGGRHCFSHVTPLTAVFPHSPGLERAVRGSVRGYQVVTGEQTAGWQMGVQLREDPDRPLPHTPPRRGQS